MSSPILRLVVGFHLGVMRMADRAACSDRGQSTVEYALVLAGIAGLVALVFAKTDVFQSIFAVAIKKVNGAIK